MLSVPFNHVNNDGKGLMLNTDISVEGLTGNADNFNNADQIWVWVPGKKTYDIFFYYDDGEEAGWSITTGGQEYFEDLTEYANGLPQGSAFYFLAKEGSKALTGSGEVEQIDQVEMDLASGTYTMIANPYPTALKLNSTQVEVTGLTGNAENFNDADQIWVWVPSKKTYDIFFYYDDGEEAGWSITTGGQEYIEDITGYENGIPAGTAFYFLAKEGTKKIVFNKNY